VKAAVLNQTRDDKVELCDDVSTVDPGPGEVCIRVRACRICHSDLSAMNGTLPALAPGIVGHAGAICVADDVPFEVAAPVGCGVMTGVGAVTNTVQVEPDSTVVVIGCGGVGISVIQDARLPGATLIVAVDPLTEKHALAQRFGATHATTPEGLARLIQSLTGGKGFDYTLEVAKHHPLRLRRRSAGWHGSGRRARQCYGGGQVQRTYQPL
jgi:Zn-dependent alcohol dehydrogenase